MKLNTFTTLVREDFLEDGTVIGEHEIEIKATYYGGCDATYWQPADPAEVKIISATIDGEDVELTEEEEEEAIESILCNPPEIPFYED
jgi:hypothetical protein